MISCLSFCFMIVKRQLIGPSKWEMKKMKKWRRHGQNGNYNGENDVRFHTLERSSKIVYVCMLLFNELLMAIFLSVNHK